VNLKAKTILILFFFSVAFLSFTLITSPAAAGDMTWVDLPISIDADGNIITVHVYGFYTIIEPFGELFVECDPDTGKEIKAYIPGVKIGEKKKITKKQGPSEFAKIIDWDNPKEILPLQMELMAPNIPTNTRPYWEIPGGYQGERLTKNEFKWPMDTSFTRLVPGSDPDNWLFVARVTNLNDSQIKANWSADLYSFGDDWFYGNNRVPISKKGENIVFGPNESKYVLLNKNAVDKYFFSEPPKWHNNSMYPPHSNGKYNTSITDTTDLSYPDDLLRKDGKMGLFYPRLPDGIAYDGPPPDPVPQIPMRLAYQVRVDGTDDSGPYWYDYYRGREFPRCDVRMECYFKPPRYDTFEWKVAGLYFRYFKQPHDIPDEEWAQIYKKAEQKATTALEFLFNKWGFKHIPYFSCWWDDDDELRVNGDTGDCKISWDGNPEGWNNCFKIEMTQCVPVSSGQVQSPGDGWSFSGYPPGSYGYTLTAPALVKYQYGTDYRDNNDYNDPNLDEIHDQCVPKGTGITETAETRYYDEDWMNILPVYIAEPVFIERYNFIPAAGDYGYLDKTVVPGYKFRVRNEHPPDLNVSIRPVEIIADCSNYYLQKVVDGVTKYFSASSKWKWTPNTGWEKLSENTYGDGQRWPSSTYTKWVVTIKTTQTYSCNNSTDYEAVFAGQSQGWPPNPTPLIFYWESEELESAFEEQADTINSISFDHFINTGQNSISIAPHQTANIYSCEKTGTVEFHSGKNTPPNLNKCNNISNSVLPYINIDKEAVVNECTTFALKDTFIPGEGGLISGAKKWLIHPRYERHHGEWGWDRDDYGKDPIGFPDCPPLAESSFTSTSASPTEGIILRPEDEVFIDTLTVPFQGIKYERNASIQLCNSVWSCPYGSRYYKFYSNGKIYPEPYPRD